MSEPMFHSTVPLSSQLAVRGLAEIKAMIEGLAPRSGTQAPEGHSSGDPTAVSEE